MELSDLKARLRTINVSCLLVMALYCYGNLTYSTIYYIIEPYQNYSYRLKTPIHNPLNKVMSYFYIKIEHRFTIYRNLLI